MLPQGDHIREVQIVDFTVAVVAGSAGAIQPTAQIDHCRTGVRFQVCPHLPRKVILPHGDLQRTEPLRIRLRSFPLPLKIVVDLVDQMHRCFVPIKVLDTARCTASGNTVGGSASPARCFLDFAFHIGSSHFLINGSFGIPSCSAINASISSKKPFGSRICDIALIVSLKYRAITRRIGFYHRLTVFEMIFYAAKLEIKMPLQFFERLERVYPPGCPESVAANLCRSDFFPCGYKYGFMESSSHHRIFFSVPPPLTSTGS